MSAGVDDQQAAMQSPLTVNAILAISTQNAQDIYPLVQVVDIRQIGNAQSTQERFRLVLSDGAYLQQAMLATQLNELIKSGSCMKNSCVRLKEYICNTVQNKKYGCRSWMLAREDRLGCVALTVSFAAVTGSSLC